MLGRVLGTSPGAIGAWRDPAPERDPGRLADIRTARRTWPSRGTCGRNRAVPCATVRLPESWDDYLATLRPRFRTKIRSVLRNLEGRGDVRFGFCEPRGRRERLLPILFDLHTRRWNQDGKPGVFGWDRKRQFYARPLAPRCCERRSLRFSWLEWNGRILACQYGFLHGDTYLHLQEGYEPASSTGTSASALRAWSIREFLDAGLREYDFLAGVGRHKTDWGAEVKESRQLVVAAPSYRESVSVCRGPEWEDRAEERCKRLVPEARAGAAPGTSASSGSPAAARAAAPS